MRCVQCNSLLSNTEACHKDEFGKYLDTCFKCLYEDFQGEDDSLEELFSDIDDLHIDP